jgi:hypothetical protein
MTGLLRLPGSGLQGVLTYLSDAECGGKGSKGCTQGLSHDSEGCTCLK